MTTGTRPKILFAFSQQVWDGFVDPVELARLETFADWRWVACEGAGAPTSAHDDPATSDAMREQIGDANALIVCHGAPYVDASIMAAAPNLRIIGELEGDRFAGRIDLDAAWERNIRTVDVTNGSSYPSPSGRSVSSCSPCATPVPTSGGLSAVTPRAILTCAPKCRGGSWASGWA
ncbi:MAG: hypothetical protein R2867_20920 [Caldilineaceae bacterium]